MYQNKNTQPQYSYEAPRTQWRPNMMDGILQAATILGSIAFVNYNMPLFGFMSFGALANGVTFGGINEIFRQTGMTIYNRTAKKARTGFFSGLLVSTATVGALSPLSYKLAPIFCSMPAISNPILERPALLIIDEVKRSFSENMKSFSYQQTTPAYHKKLPEIILD